MSEFEKLRAELSTVNLSALADEIDISLRQLQRIRTGKVTSTTLRTVERIRAGLKALEQPSARRRNKRQEATV